MYKIKCVKNFIRSKIFFICPIADKRNCQCIFYTLKIFSEDYIRIKYKAPAVILPGLL